MRILDTMAASGPDVIYTELYFHTLESHLEYLRNASGTTVLNAELEKTSKYVGDFYSLLCDTGIHHQYHWIILRVNELDSPFDFNPEIHTTILVPEQRLLDQILVVHKSTSTVTI